MNELMNRGDVVSRSSSSEDEDLLVSCTYCTSRYLARFHHEGKGRPGLDFFHHVGRNRT